MLIETKRVLITVNKNGTCFRITLRSVKNHYFSGRDGDGHTIESVFHNDLHFSFDSGPGYFEMLSFGLTNDQSTVGVQL